MENVIKELEKMEKDGIETLKIYYVEDIKEGSESWSVDVMQDELNNLCDMNWTWTIIHINDFKITLKEFTELTYSCNSWEIVVDKPFSEDVVCETINIWLKSNDIDIKTEMIDIKDAEGSGFVKDLKERLVENKDLLK